MPYKASIHRTRDRSDSRREASAMREQQRPDRGFTASSRWRTLRAIVLAEQPLCVECLKADRVVPAVEVDHIEPRDLRPDLTFVRSNLQGLCKKCHGEKTRREHCRYDVSGGASRG